MLYTQNPRGRACGNRSVPYLACVPCTWKFPGVNTHSAIARECKKNHPKSRVSTFGHYIASCETQTLRKTHARKFHALSCRRERIHSPTLPQVMHTCCDIGLRSEIRPLSGPPRTINDQSPLHNISLQCRYIYTQPLEVMGGGRGEKERFKDCTAWGR